MKGNKTQKGITMVALIITIIVLLILAVVAISSITDENGGLIAKVEQAVSRWEEAEVDENTELGNYYNYINSIYPGNGDSGDAGSDTPVACTVHVYDGHEYTGSGSCKNCEETIEIDWNDSCTAYSYMGTGCGDDVDWEFWSQTEMGVMHRKYLICGTCKHVTYEDSMIECTDSNSDGKCDVCEATMAN